MLLFENIEFDLIGEYYQDENERIDYTVSIPVMVDWKEQCNYLEGFTLYVNDGDKGIIKPFTQDTRPFYTGRMRDWTKEPLYAVPKKFINCLNKLYSDITWENRKGIEKLKDFIEDNGITEPLQLEISLQKLKHDPKKQGNDVRYLKTYALGKDITNIVAKATNYNISNAKDTKDCVIIRGTGMDMAFILQNKLYHNAVRAGYPNMIDKSEYKIYNESTYKNDIEEDIEKDIER